MAGSFKDDSVATQQTITVSRKVMGHLKEILACFLPPHCPMPHTLYPRVPGCTFICLCYLPMIPMRVHKHKKKLGNYVYSPDNYTIYISFLVLTFLLFIKSRINRSMRKLIRLPTLN